MTKFPDPPNRTPYPGKPEGFFSWGWTQWFQEIAKILSDPLTPGTGTVTSVALTVPSELSVSGSPITSAGTLAITKGSEPANRVAAGPTSGGSAPWAFRALVAADVPDIAEAQVTNLVADLALKAPLASPALTGTPTAPTATLGDDSTKIATTAFVENVIDNLVAGDIPNIAESQVTNLVSDLALKAPLASPALTGNPTAPTQAPGDNTTKIATDAFVTAAVAAGAAPVTSVFTRIGAVVAATNDYSEAQISFTDITTNDVTSTKHGYAPKSPADATKFMNGAATPAYALVKDSDLSTSNVTTNNVTIAKHGFAPILPNDAAKYLDGTGAYSVPSGTGTGSVTSVAQTVPTEMTISGSPVTTSGTLALDWNSASGNKVIASPAGGGSGAYAGRALVALDIPNIAESQVTSLVSDLALKAPLASPALTGVPTAPTAAALTNTTQLATTAFDTAAVAVETSRATTAEALKAPLASPTFTGVPAAPTAAAGTNTTQLATTAFVTAAGTGTGTNSVIDAQVPTGTLTGDSTDQTVFTTTIAAARLSVGTLLRVTYWASALSGAAARTVKLFFGSTSVTLESGTATNNLAFWQGFIAVTGAATQTMVAAGVRSAAPITNQIATPAETISGSIVLKATFNVANTVTYKGQYWLVEVLQP